MCHCPRNHSEIVRIKQDIDKANCSDVFENPRIFDASVCLQAGLFLWNLRQKIHLPV